MLDVHLRNKQREKVNVKRETEKEGTGDLYLLLVMRKDIRVVHELLIPSGDIGVRTIPQRISLPRRQMAIGFTVMEMTDKRGERSLSLTFDTLSIDERRRKRVTSAALPIV
jgi:hypothetical protein